VAKMQSVHRWTGRAIGLDLHRDFCEVAICEEGVTHSAGRVPMTPEGIEVLADSLLPTDRVVMEVSSAAWEIARRSEGRCQRVVVVSPDDRIPSWWIASRRLETPRIRGSRTAWRSPLCDRFAPQAARALTTYQSRRVRPVGAASRDRHRTNPIVDGSLKRKDSLTSPSSPQRHS
jgi:hypothetical protein